MVLSWIAWFFLTLSTVLICIAGLHYRKQRREGRHPSQQSGLAGVEKNGANHHTEHSR